MRGVKSFSTGRLKAAPAGRGFILWGLFAAICLKHQDLWETNAKTFRQFYIETYQYSKYPGISLKILQAVNVESLELANMRKTLHTQSVPRKRQTAYNKTHIWRMNDADDNRNRGTDQKPA